MHSLPERSIDADETLPETAYRSISEMIAETLVTMSDDETPWPNVLAPQRGAHDLFGFTKTF